MPHETTGAFQNPGQTGLHDRPGRQNNEGENEPNNEQLDFRSLPENAIVEGDVGES